MPISTVSGRVSCEGQASLFVRELDVLFIILAHIHAMIDSIACKPFATNSSALVSSSAGDADALTRQENRTTER